MRWVSVVGARMGGGGGVLRRTMFIQTRSNPNPDALQFYPQVPILQEGQSLDFASLKSAARSPLARALFTIEGVTGVYLSQEFITIKKRSDVPWTQIKPAAFETMMDFFASGRPVVEEGQSGERKDTQINDDDDEVVIAIKEIIDTHIRPSVAQDGGDVEYVGFKDGVVMVKMQGSCSGCPSSGATLKGGIERMLMHYVPEVTNVIEVDDDDLKKINLDAFQKVAAGHQ